MNIKYINLKKVLWKAAIKTPMQLIKQMMNRHWKSIILFTYTSTKVIIGLKSHYHVLQMESNNLRNWL